MRCIIKLLCSVALLMYQQWSQKIFAVIFEFLNSFNLTRCKQQRQKKTRLQPKETGSIKSSFQGFKVLKKLATLIFACFLSVIWPEKVGEPGGFFLKKVTPSDVCCLHECLHDHETTILAYCSPWFPSRHTSCSERILLNSASDGVKL